jgi:hypothetical protein
MIVADVALNAFKQFKAIISGVQEDIVVLQ